MTSQFTEEEAHLLDLMLMLHAEHGGGNNSTFACRALSSSRHRHLQRHRRRRWAP